MRSGAILWLVLFSQLILADTTSTSVQSDSSPDASQDNAQETLIEPEVFNLYGSIRIRYRETDTGSVWGDGGSRFGLSGRGRFKQQTWLLGRGELGINLLDAADYLFNRGDRPAEQTFGDNLFLRLLYLGIETPDFMLTAGKNWSTYYRVSGFTDQFQGTGASASGTFNAGTDGGPTGTGRADNVLQTRIRLNPFAETKSFMPFQLNFQLQHGEPIPAVTGFDYQTNIGMSILLDNDKGLAFGLAYNHATIDDNDLSELNRYGIDGDATAMVVGARWYSDDFYLGAVVSRLENHETTNTDIYFDGTVWEIYGQYRLHDRWWAVAGWNMLEPDNSEVQAGDYKVDYSVLGLRYSFQDFRQMIFANVRLESGSTQDGASLGDVYTIGIRWDLP